MIRSIQLLNESPDDIDRFYITIRDGSNVWVGEYERDGGKWHERTSEVLSGEEGYGFGGKTYMSYLTPDEIRDWLLRDYDDASPVRTDPYRPWEGERVEDEEIDEMAVGAGSIAAAPSRLGGKRRRVEEGGVGEIDEARRLRVAADVIDLYKLEKDGPNPDIRKALIRLYTIAFTDGVKAQINSTKDAQ